TSVCTAVGQDQNEAGGVTPLVEGWNAAGWTVRDTPQPIGAASSPLFAVFCSAGVCTAAGSSNPNGTGHTFVERASPSICAVDDAACVSNGVFVSPSGNDTGAGTRAQPKRTLAAAIATAGGKRENVYVMVGTYNEMLNLATGVGNGVSVYGGYGSSWQLSSDQYT